MLPIVRPLLRGFNFGEVCGTGPSFWVASWVFRLRLGTSFGIWFVGKPEGSSFWMSRTHVVGFLFGKRLCFDGVEELLCLITC